MLVDDERIALDRLRHMLDWARHGYEIAGTATNGRSALRLCEEIRPQIVIADIRMPVMDGLALIRAAAERKLGAVFVIMSAYEDFEYARQAIALGNVSRYLIKHEMEPGLLLEALRKAGEDWTAGDRRRRLERSRLLKRALADGGAAADWAAELGPGTGSDFRPPYAVALAQEDAPFGLAADLGLAGLSLGLSLGCDGVPAAALACACAGDELEPPSDHPDWTPVGEFELDRARLVAVYAQANRAAPKSESFRELAAALRSRLASRLNRSVSIFYSFHEDDLSSLSRTVRRVEAAARHAVFCGAGALVCADSLPIGFANDPRPAARAAPPAELAEAAEAIRRLDAERTESAVNRLFEAIVRPQWDLSLLHETIRVLTAAGNEVLAARGLPAEEPLDPRRAGPALDLGSVRKRLKDWIAAVCAAAGGRQRLSGKLQKAIRYIGEHYHEDINIEDVAYTLGISASYLHQLFKREMDRTFLDVLTEVRIEQAKRILSREDAKMADVCARVGYRSPQHFSQVFKKATGVPPHLFRHGVYPG